MAQLRINPNRRSALLAVLALPAGCAFRPLPPLPVEPAAPPDGPVRGRAPALGHRWTYRRYNGFNGALLATETDEVVQLAPQAVLRRVSDAQALGQEEWQGPWGQVLRDLHWDRIQTYEPALPLWPAQLQPGRTSRHEGHYRVSGQSYRYWLSVRSRVQGWEQVRVPAGTMRALRIEHFQRLQHHDPSRMETTRRDTLWLAPETGRWVAREVSGQYLIPDENGSYRGLEDHHRWELTEWR